MNNITGQTGFVELLYGVLFSPKAAFRRIVDENLLFQGFVIFVVITLLTSLIDFLGIRNFSGIPSEFVSSFSQAGPYLGITAVVFAFISWFFKAGILQLFAELLGGQGRAVEVLTVLALAATPKVFVIPFQVLGFFLVGSFAASFLSVAVSISVSVWSLVLVVIGIRETQKLSGGRAVAAVALPLGVLGLAFIIVAVSMVGFAAPYFTSIM